MKKRVILYLAIATSAFVLATVFRHEYVTKTVRFSEQNLLHIDYEIVLRINRLTGEKCIFEGGLQLVEVFDENVIGSNQDKVFDKTLHELYKEAALCNEAV
jgi:hypothetical protein